MTSLDLTSARRADFDALAARCVSCGLCLPACPTFDLLDQESDAPRGRIHLMQAMVAGTLAVEDGRDALDRCLGCRACETACPAGVQYGEMLEIVRSGGGRRTHAIVSLLLHLVERPRLLALAMRGRALARLVPSSLAASARVMDPAARVTWERRAPGAPKAVVLRGCVMQHAFGPAQQAAVDVLARCGYDVVDVPAQGCCGALHLHNGELDRGETLRDRLLASIPDDAVLVSTSAGCGAALRERDARVLDLTEALLRAPEPPRVEPSGERVAVFDACHLRHAQGIVGPSRDVLRASGYEPAELAGAGRCCGAAGVYSLTQPELSLRLRESRVEAIRASGARTVSCGNPGCALQLRAGLAEAGLDVRVAHPAELALEAGKAVAI